MNIKSFVGRDGFGRDGRICVGAGKFRIRHHGHGRHGPQTNRDGIRRGTGCFHKIGVEGDGGPGRFHLADQVVTENDGTDL